MTYFTYNGRSSAEFGLHIEKKDVFSAPEYDAEFISHSPAEAATSSIPTADFPTSK